MSSASASASASFLDIVPYDRVFGTDDNSVISYSFELDPFQKMAQHYIQKDESVIITAHTSAGKTIPAEIAIAYAKSRNLKAYYTSPIKTLSNQKYSEFLKKFGDVGLLTGDIKLNPEAQCVIMTTEILRDLLNKEPDLPGVGCVIFDEIHFINNPQRGHVWETCLINLPPRIQIVGLSATISEAPKFAEWIGRVKNRPIHLISTVKRPVPLNHYAYTPEDNQIHLILDNDGHFHEPNYRKYMQAYIKGRPANLLNLFIAYLKQNKLSPAIFFVLSRKKCENFANQVNLSLVDVKEQSLITNEINRCLAKCDTPTDMLNRMPQVNLIRQWAIRGIGVHHSGLIPVLKEIVEILFSQGLIKVLFATETFAVGVNTPTKTVIFTEMMKYCDGQDQPRLLKPDEYLQMSGRAGRRGLDKFGTVVHLPLTEVYELEEVRTLLMGKSARIESKFKINYRLVLDQFIQSKNIEESETPTLVTNSYLAQQDSDRIRHLTQELQTLESQLKEVQTQLGIYPYEMVQKIQEYLSLEAKLKGNHEINGLSLRLDKKQEKKLKTQWSQVHAEVQTNPSLLPIKNLLEHQAYLQTNLNQSRGQILGYQNDLLDQYQSCVAELKHLEYINAQDQVTMKGLMCHKLISANGVLITDLIIHQKLQNLDLATLGSVLSLFCDSSKNEDSQYAKGLPFQVSELVDWVYETCEYYTREYPMYAQDLEGLGLDLTYVKATYYWSQGQNYFEILPLITPNEGNFVRNMVRLSHICDEIISACEIAQEPLLEKKLRDLKEVLIRDPVNSDSLYLKL